MKHSSNPTLAARLTGLTYLVMIVLSAVGYIAMTRLLAGEDPRAILDRVTTSHAAFTLALTAMALGFTLWIVLAVMLYRLMGASGKLAGLLMLIFTLAGAVMNLRALSHLSPLLGTLNRMDGETLAPMVQHYNRQLLLAQLFSGLWMFPFGWLVLRSRIAPRLLGWCLIIGGIGYVLVFATAFAPNLDHVTAFRVAEYIPGAPAMIGELGTCLWLLVMGDRTRNRAIQARNRELVV